MTGGRTSRWSGPHPVGTDAWVVRVAGPEQAASLARHLRSARVPCGEVVPAAATVLLDGRHPGLPREVFEERLHALLEAWHPDEEAASGEVVRVPVTYDGPDLGRVARAWGVTEDEVVARHTSLELVATFTGFAPGFSYLAGLPEAWAVPRLESPRSRVPAGAVGIADRWCGIYPSPSPGGWNLLGRTTLQVWDLDRADGPSLLAPGTRVRFEAA